MDSASNVSPKFAPIDRYISPEIAKLERERLWPKTWLMAGRVEQLESVGDFVTFDIATESIIIVRSASDTLRAFYNVCQHRGRRLKSGCGNTGKSIFCPFHGWKWSIEGKLERVVNQEDWDMQGGLAADQLGLQPVRVDTWAGWVFVSMDPDIEPLLDYLAPLPEILKNYELENCRIGWYKTIKFPVNWKTFLNAFNENYHVETTHAQLNKYGLMKAPAMAHGKHAQFLIEHSAGAANLGSAKNFPDLLTTIEYREDERHRLLAALVSEYSLTASKKLRNHIAPDAPAPEMIAKYRELHRAEMEAAGAKWPDKLTAADIARAGIDWHIFPNMIVLPSIDGALLYRSRPDGENTESCFYDIWWIQRYGEGKAPPIKHEFYPTPESFEGQNPFLEQDFSNMIGVQKGMHSRGFRGAILNPVQEVAISNFERVLDEYLSREP